MLFLPLFPIVMVPPVPAVMAALPVAVVAGEAVGEAVPGKSTADKKLMRIIRKTKKSEKIPRKGH